MRKSLLTIAALAALGAQPVAAQTYPSKAISIVIPLGAGGAMDSHHPRHRRAALASGSASR